MKEYISREYLGLTDFEIIMCNGDYKAGLKMLLEKIESAPAADVVERKVGHWIFHPEQKNIYGGKLIECSECRTQYLVMNVVEEIYCRHCGSKNQNGGQDDV